MQNAVLKNTCFCPLNSKKSLKNLSFFKDFFARSIFHRESWWSRRELNSRLTRLPKGFLHAYAAFNLKKTSLRPKQSFRRNLNAAALPTSRQVSRSPPELTPVSFRREKGTDELR